MPRIVKMLQRRLCKADMTDKASQAAELLHKLTSSGIFQQPDRRAGELMRVQQFKYADHWPIWCLMDRDKMIQCFITEQQAKEAVKQ